MPLSVPAARRKTDCPAGQVAAPHCHCPGAQPGRAARNSRRPAARPAHHCIASNETQLRRNRGPGDRSCDAGGCEGGQRGARALLSVGYPRLLHRHPATSRVSGKFRSAIVTRSELRQVEALPALESKRRVTLGVGGRAAIAEARIIWERSGAGKLKPDLWPARMKFTRRAFFPGRAARGSESAC